MRNITKILLLTIVAVTHVHLNMFTVENGLNPSFWISFVFISPPFDKTWSIFSNIIIIGVHCIVTSLLAKYLLKWSQARMWLLSYIICVFVYLIIYQFMEIPSEIALDHVYDNIYGYGGAFNRCFTFSIVQIIFIIVYILITKNNRTILYNWKTPENSKH